MAKEKTFRFLGKVYPLEGNDSYHGGTGDAPIYIVKDAFTGMYRALTRRDLGNAFFADDGRGSTTQRAASALERAMIREFKQRAKLLGYEVEG